MTRSDHAPGRARTGPSSSFDHEQGHPQRKQILAVMCLALGAVLSAVASLNVALPVLARDTGASQTELQWIIDAYALVFAALLLPAGALGDRFGRRRTLIVGLAIFGLGSLGAMFVDEPVHLIMIRGLLGIGAAMVMPSTLSIITTTHPPKERAAAIGVWAGVAGGSAVLGLLVAGTLLEFFSWPSVFGLNAVLAVLALVAIFAVVPESADPEEARLDPIGALLSVLGLVGVVYAIIEGPDRGWTDAVTLTSMIAGLVVLALFIGWELHHRQPMLDPRLFSSRRFSAGTLSICMQFFTFFGFIFLFLQYLQLVRGYRPIVAALCLVPAAICLIATARRTPHLVEKFGAARLAPIGILLMAIGFGVLFFTDTGTSYWIMLIGLVPLGIGMGLATTPATDAIVTSLPDEKQGVGSAMNDAAREVGGTLGIAVLGSILNATYRSQVVDATRSLPPKVGKTAEESLGVAVQFLSSDKQLARFIPAAQHSFVNGFTHAMGTASVLLLIISAGLALLLRGSGDASDHSQHATDPTETGTPVTR